MQLRHGLLSFAATLLICAPADAEISVVDAEDFSLGVGAYVGEFTALQHIPYDAGGLVPEYTGLNSAVARIEWRAGIGDSVTVEIHDRFAWLATTATQQPAASLGLGSTVPPERSFDLRSELLDEPGVTLEHDLDRAAVNVFTDFADFTVGRQAVTWGKSSLFTVGDIWTQFSPFELDTSQKRGVDAVRALAYPGGGVELEFLVVDRGSLDDLSGGVRAGWTTSAADYYGAVAKNYDEIVGLMGGAADVGSVRAHAELSLPYSLDGEQLELPRATIGADYFSSKFTLLAEYHFNGPGASAPDDYLTQFTGTDLARGQRYFVGKHYLGLVGSYLPVDRLTLSLANIVNLLDPSLLVSPTLSYELSDNVTTSLGAYLGFGEDPSFSTIPPLFRSEFGLYGRMYYLQISAFL